MKQTFKVEQLAKDVPSGKTPAMVELVLPDWTGSLESMTEVLGCGDRVRELAIDALKVRLAAAYIRPMLNVGKTAKDIQDYIDNLVPEFDKADRFVGYNGPRQAATPIKSNADLIALAKSKGFSMEDLIEMAKQAAK